MSGWTDLLRGANAARISALAGGVVLHAVFIFIVATVMPSAVAEIGGIAYYAWATTLFAVGSIAGSAACAPLLARFAPRGAWRLGLGLFMLGSIACAAAPSMGAMIAGRAMQGLGGGLLTALAYAMIPLLFPEALRPRAIALVSSVWGAAALGGPLVGGAFAEFGLWRGAFAVGLPAAGCVALLAERVLPPGAGDAPRGPLPGLPGLRLALIAGAALALSAGGLPGRLWASALGIIASLTLLTAAVRLDRRAARRLLPRGAFDPRVPAGSVVAMMGLMVLGFGTAPFVPYVLRMAHGASPVLAGYVVAAASLAWTLASFATAGASPERVRLLLALAPAVMAAAFLGVAASIAAGQAVPLVAVFWALVGSAVGIGWAHLASLLIASVPADERPLAAAFVTTLQIAATAFGAALAGLVSNLAGLAVATTPDEVASAARWLFAAFAAPLAALPTLVRLRSLVRATSAGPG